MHLISLPRTKDCISELRKRGPGVEFIGRKDILCQVACLLRLLQTLTKTF